MQHEIAIIPVTGVVTGAFTENGVDHVFDFGVSYTAHDVIRLGMFLYGAIGWPVKLDAEKVNLHVFGATMYEPSVHPYYLRVTEATIDIVSGTTNQTVHQLSGKAYRQMLSEMSPIEMGQCNLDGDDLTIELREPEGAWVDMELTIPSVDEPSQQLTVGAAGISDEEQQFQLVLTEVGSSTAHIHLL